VAYSGGSLGAILAPLIVTPVFQWWGWRAAFWFTGLIGVAWLCCGRLYRGGQRSGHTARRDRFDARATRGRSGAVGLLGSYALGALPLAFVLYSAPLYLAKPLGCSQGFIGRCLAASAGLGGRLLFLGWMADHGRVAMRELILIAGALSLPFVMIPYVGGWPEYSPCFAWRVSRFRVHCASGDACEPGLRRRHAGLIAGAGAEHGARRLRW
jgi:ACS family hexuronate transporter-like MFS transporter